MEWRQPLFDHSEYPELNKDFAILRHELGHAVTWFHFGEGIGRLNCCRCPDKQLNAGVALWPREGQYELLWKSPKYAKPYAERLLAGEIAARRAPGMTTSKICSKGLPVDSDTCVLANTLARIDPNCDLAKEDIFKVLTLAINHAQSGWREWVGERLTRASAVVEQYGTAIDQIARKLERHLPTAGKSRIWPGFQIISEMRRCGVQSDKQPPVEIVFNGQRGNFLTRLRRFMQEMGRNGIVCRYVDYPTNVDLGSRR